MFTHSQMKEAALDAANFFRAALGREPATELAPGIPDVYYRCAIAATVDPDGQYEVYNTSRLGKRIVYLVPPNLDWDEREEQRIAVFESEAAWQFVMHFDSRQFPELVIASPSW